MAHDAQHSVNVAECLALADFIEKNPERFDMHEWCGSACCIAGHLAARHSVDVIRTSYEDLGSLLGIDGRAARILFLAEESGLNLRHILPVQAARVLRHLAATGEVDWSVALEGGA